MTAKELYPSPNFHTPTVWQFWAVVGGGSGVFYDSGQALGSTWSRVVAMGDADGDIDAFVGNGSGSGVGQANKVWLNDREVFSDSGQSPGNLDTFVVVLGDLDGDGDLDALDGNNSGVHKVWLNDGTGLFNARWSCVAITRVGWRSRRTDQRLPWTNEQHPDVAYACGSIDWWVAWGSG